MAARYIHLKGQKRVVGLDPNLLHMADIEIVSEGQAKTLTEKYDKERRKARDQNESERIRSVAENTGVELTGSDYEDDDVRERREERESRQAIKVTGDRVRPESDQNINNDPDMPGGVGEQHQAVPHPSDTGAQADFEPEGHQAEGAAHKEAFLKRQHEQDLTLAEKIARAEQQPEGASEKRRDEPQEETRSKRGRKE